jgi:hypothetical protein
MYKKIKKVNIISVFLIFCFMSTFNSVAQNYNITTHISKGLISINEPFLVIFEITAKTDSFQKLQFPGFKILKGPTYSFSVQRKDRKINKPEINKYTTDTSYSSSLKYLLVPLRSGQLIIHGVVFYSNNKELKSPDTIIEVSDNIIQSSDSIKIRNELWPDTYIDKLAKEKVDSTKIDVSIIELTSDFKEKKVKLNETFTITYKLNYLLFNKIVTDFSDFEVIQSPKINIEWNEIHANQQEENYNSQEVYNNWVSIIKPKKKGTFIIKPAVIYIKGQLIRSNEIKITVK